MNIIEIKLCAEDRARLDRLAAALENARTPIIVDETLAELEDYERPEIAPKSPQEAPEAEQGETTPPEPETPKEAEEPAAPAVSDDDLRSKYMTLSATPKREQARQIIKAYAEKISDIPEGKRAEVLEKLTALEG